jgi:NADH:ubiquinone oxidoreductase subunit
VLKAFFTWWNGSSWGVRGHIRRHGQLVGEDEFGNKYYESKTDFDAYDPGRKRRWVVFNGYAEASKVPPDWHGWLHYTFDEPPTKAPLLRRAYEKDHVPNLSGSLGAWRPPGSIARGGERSAAAGDYEAWSPE